MPWKARVPLLAAALWWGSLTAVGFIAVPLLFANLPAATAGQMAARLFTGQAWTSVVCGVLVLMAQKPVRPEPLEGHAPASTGSARTLVAQSLGSVIGFVLAGLLLALLGEFAVAPHIVARQDLAFWHAAGTAFYGVQWLCALAVLWKLSAPSA